MRSTTYRRRGRAGFTLLEVMISIAILSLGLTIVFGGSIMASRGTAHARFITQAALVARCRVTEAEAYIRINQLPVDDQDLEDPPDRGGERCCEPPFECTASVDRIRLPPPVDIETRAGDRLLAAGISASRSQNAAGPGGGSSGGDGGLGGSNGPAGTPITQLAGALTSLGGAGGGSGGGLGGLLAGMGGGGGGGMSGSGAPSISSMAEQLMAGIYPTLQPLLEGAIRRLRVRVNWHEGTREYRITVNEYLTNPGQSMPTGEQMDSIQRALGGAAGTPAAGTGTAGSGQSGAQTPQTPAATVTIPGMR